jgi:hypothetical protein
MNKVFSSISSHRHASVTLLCLAAIALTLLGCGRSGPAYWPVGGKVTFQGKPIGIASIRFCNPKAAFDVVESLDAKGQYTVVTGDRKGMPEGQYEVAVMPKLDFSNVKCDKDGFPLLSTMPSALERNPPNIPAKYHDPATSGLVVTVKPESNTFDVDMQ